MHLTPGPSRACINRPHHYHRRLEDFLTFLASSPRTRSYVLELRLIRPRFTNCVDDAQADAGAVATCHLAVLAEVVQKLPHLRTLHLQGVVFPTPEPFVTPSTWVPRSLHRFEYIIPIAYGYSIGVGNATNVLSLFSSIRLLHLQGWNFDLLESTTSPDPLSSELSIEALNLVNFGGIDAFLRKFGPVLASTVSPVTSLQLTVGPQRIFSDALAIGHLWRIVSPTLVNLTLDLKRFQGCEYAGYYMRLYWHIDCASAVPKEADVINSFDMSYCPKLTSATLDLYLQVMPTVPRVLQNAKVILSRLLACPLLHHVTIHADVADLPRLQASHKEPLEKVEAVLLKLLDRRVDITVFSRGLTSWPPLIEDCTTRLFPRIKD
ncbi:hypothetical protein NM688_g1382 [Phlebia brevispora]|uniref:Uncharacterized protein n=1 Tax=Phlebia brevispora TaxID=194682 RepID=A0ACC1TBV1_9APHY|nr:hypothetical protein NM688_g1382 [Phlebia brevispora]